MKTKVRVKYNISQEPLMEGDIGYIDGYVRAADDRAYAVVVVGSKIGLAMVHELEVII